MPKLSNNEFDEILSEYASQVQSPKSKVQGQFDSTLDFRPSTLDSKLTGERFFDGLELDAQIYDGATFSELPAEEQSKFNLITETAEEVLAEEKAKARAA